MAEVLHDPDVDAAALEAEATALRDDLADEAAGLAAKAAEYREKLGDLLARARGKGTLLPPDLARPLRAARAIVDAIDPRHPGVLADLRAPADPPADPPAAVPAEPRAPATTPTA